MSIKNWLKFIGLGLLWGSSYFWIKIGLREVEPVTLTALRISFASLALSAVVYFYHVPLPNKKDLKYFLFLGVFNLFLPFLLTSYSEKYISSALASILNSTVPLITILIAPLFVADDRWTLPKFLGLLVGFLGVVVLMSGRLEGSAGDYRLGQVIMLLAALSYSVSAVFARLKVRGLDPRTQAFGQMFMALLAIWPAAFLIESPVVLPRLPLSWVAGMWLGLLCSATGTMLFFSLLQSIGPTRTTVSNYLFPLVGVLLGAIILKESVDWHLLAGGCLIISGVVVVNARPSFLQRFAKVTGGRNEGRVES